VLFYKRRASNSKSNVQMTDDSKSAMSDEEQDDDPELQQALELSMMGKESTLQHDTIPS